MLKARKARRRGLRPLPRLPLVGRRPPGPPVRRPGVVGFLGWLDQSVLWLMRTRGHAQPVEGAMRALGLAGEWAAVWIVLGLAGAASDERRRRRWLRACAVGPAAVGLNYAVKVAVGRDRPLIEEHPPLARAPTKLSFPSAHATSSVAGATALARVEPRLRLPAYSLAAAICLTRPYLGMHYPSDVLAGVVLGAVVGRAVPRLGEPSVEERLMDLVARAGSSSAPSRDGGPAAGAESPQRAPERSGP